MNAWKAFFERLRASHLAAGLVSAAGVLAYLVQSLLAAHRLPSTLDEGNYLFKGLLFARGVYTPFQDYGPWTNKMPLAFLIPGWAQELFGPGLRSGRYFAVALGILMLLGLWLTARRLGGRWWAAGVVWAVAANPGLIEMYSQALSEGLVAAMLAWVMALSLGRERRLWALLAGSALAALVVMTRQNMLPLVGFVALYILWDHGWRRGMYASLAIALVLVVGHAIYWPNILSIWRPWLPFKLPLAAVGSGGRLAVTTLLPADFSSVLPSAPRINLAVDLYPIWDALRYYFVPIFGAICLWALWPRAEDWKSRSHFRIAVIFSVLLVLLSAAHAWAAIAKDFCPYCLSIYLSFFSEIGLILIVVSFSAWRRRLGLLRGSIAALLVLLFSTGMGFGAYQALDDALLTIQIPRVTGMRFLPGTTDLWRSLSNKFSLSYEVLQRAIPAAAGLLIGLALLVGAALLVRWLRRSGTRWSPAALALLGLLGLGALLSPTEIFGAANPVDCGGGDVIASYEQAGKALAAEVPPDSLVYWRGGLSPVPLLYIPAVRVFPPQLNGSYSFSQSSDSDRLYRKGSWNQELSLQWQTQADYILVEDRSYKGSFKREIDSSRYNELESTPAIITCRERSKIRVFRREK